MDISQVEPVLQAQAHHANVCVKRPGTAWVQTANMFRLHTQIKSVATACNKCYAEKLPEEDVGGKRLRNLYLHAQCLCTRTPLVPSNQKQAPVWYAQAREGKNNLTAKTCQKG